MKGYYFFKAHISSFVDDADINLLDNWAWKLYWQCYAVAQEYSQEGLLPPIAKLAYRIRANDKTLTDALDAMRTNGLAIETDDGWILTRFAPEQESASNTERVQAHRERERNKRNLPDNDDVTLCSQSKKRGEVEEEKEEEEKKEEKEIPKLVVVCNLYEQNIGVIVPKSLTELENATAKYPLKWIEEAISVAVKADKRRWDYVAGILKNWETKGRGSKKANGNGSDPDRYTTGEFAEYIE